MEGHGLADLFVGKVSLHPTAENYLLRLDTDDCHIASNTGNDILVLISDFKHEKAAVTIFEEDFPVC